VNNPARIKQLFDIVQIDDGKFLSNIKNSLNALRFGFGIPEGQIKIAAGLHGPANLLNYDDYVWEKYKIGEWLKMTDPSTGAAAVKNLFYKSESELKQESSVKDPDDLDSIYQDTSMQALQSRGAQFIHHRLVVPVSPGGAVRDGIWTATASQRSQMPGLSSQIDNWR